VIPLDAERTIAIVPLPLAAKTLSLVALLPNAASPDPDAARPPEIRLSVDTIHVPGDVKV
jgi:hypothetical protein